MYQVFDKESLFFITDDYIKEEKERLNTSFNFKILSEFLSEIQFIIYYINPSQCDNIVYLNPINHHYDILKKMFPMINFYFDHDEALDRLSENDKTFAIISNTSYKDMEYQKLIIERYDPYAALLDFHLNSQPEYKYLDGILYRKLFSNSANLKLVVRGIGYKYWKLNNCTRQWVNYQTETSNNKYMNPFSNDNKTIYKERGFYNTFNETAMTIILMDYLKKINKLINFDSLIKILIFVLDNLIEGKKINLDIEYVIN
jgi:hypothetical protein